MVARAGRVSVATSTRTAGRPRDGSVPTCNPVLGAPERDAIIIGLRVGGNLDQFDVALRRNQSAARSRATDEVPSDSRRRDNLSKSRSRSRKPNPFGFSSTKDEICNVARLVAASPDPLTLTRQHLQSRFAYRRCSGLISSGRRRSSGVEMERALIVAMPMKSVLTRGRSVISVSMIVASPGRIDIL